jgi:hypothetical protein
MQEPNQTKLVNLTAAKKFLVVRMRRHFFHVFDNDNIFRDENGRRFDTMDDAVAHATTIAAELGRDGDHYRGVVVSVTDEEGRELARLAVPSKHES